VAVDSLALGGELHVAPAPVVADGAGAAVPAAAAPGTDAGTTARFAVVAADAVGIDELPATDGGGPVDGTGPVVSGAVAGAALASRDQFA